MMIRTIAASAILSLTMSGLPAYAADDRNAANAVPALTVPERFRQSLSQQAGLPALYVSYATLQAFDVYSTRQALARGAREANPLMRGVVSHPGAFIAVKAAVAAGTILAAERLWKTNKPAAIAVMVAANSVAAVVAVHNARTLRRLP